MSDECISPLRRRMIEDMTVRKFTEKTQNDYIRVVKNFTIFLGRSPDIASNEDLRRFQLHLNEKRVGAPTINGFNFGRRPPIRPSLRAASRPALVRCFSMARSNSANAPTICIIIRPAGVVVSTASVRLRKPAFFS